MVYKNHEGRIAFHATNLLSSNYASITSPLTQINFRSPVSDATVLTLKIIIPGSRYVRFDYAKRNLINRNLRIGRIARQ